MRNLFLILAFLFTSSLFLTNCGSEGNKEENKDTVVVEKKSNSEILLAKIVENGDIINSEKVPTLIAATDVNAALAGGTMHIIDLRDGKAFSEGHIPGANSVKPNELLDYIKTLDMGSFEKVVLVCYSGQIASYSAAVLQMMGYSNVYSMKYGMAAWNTKFADKWLKSIGSKLEANLSTTPGAKGEAGKLPDFECKKTSADDILEERAALVLSEGFAAGSISLDEYLANKDRIYLVNYWPAEVYNLGHLEGAVQYTPKQSMGLNADLLTLPTDKVIVVYCFTGQHSSFVAAYLRMLGYNAKSLKFGANSFMNSMMLKNEQIGHGFDKKQVNNFKMETSEYVEEPGAQQGGC